MQSLIGTGVALVTPFKKDFSIDVEALKAIVNFQVDNGIDYLVVLGTTAESATLSKTEKEFPSSQHEHLRNGYNWSGTTPRYRFIAKYIEGRSPLLFYCL